MALLDGMPAAAGHCHSGSAGGSFRLPSLPDEGRHDRLSLGCACMHVDQGVKVCCGMPGTSRQPSPP